ncbi:GNAT family N-acetyltransferase [Pelomonas sp. KK5]|uniref:GNAT family N-acetyltransferase n=1 Tax=Pelomonas sp. KK5 TaxID=1855730 RepID=UPI00097BBD05|nr:GNAT family protein [Pelomonas sp. KK5]
MSTTTSFATLALHTARLTLRPTAPADAAALLAINADPEVARYLSRPAWTDIAQAEARIAQDAVDMAAGTHLRLAVEHESRLVGDCTLFNWSRQCRRAEIGYVLGRAAWGRGLMHEALTALVGFGFGPVMDLHRIEADIDPRNEGSAKTLERLGFMREGLLRERWIVSGEVSDSALYGLLRSDWARRAQSS